MKYNDLTLLVPGIVIQLFIYSTNKCTTIQFIYYHIFWLYSAISRESIHQY